MRLRVPQETVVLPRPNAGWKKIQCILRFMVRLNRSRRRARGEIFTDRSVPGLTNAMRAIIVTRCMAIRYEDEQDPYDTLEDFLHETVMPGAGDADDDDEYLEGGQSGRSAGGRRDASNARAETSETASGKAFDPENPDMSKSRFLLEVRAPPKLVVNKYASTRALMRFASSVAGDFGSPPAAGPSPSETPDMRRQESMQSGSSGGGGDQDKTEVLTTKDKIFLTFNDPEFSETSKWVSLVILSLIIVSTTSFILDTRPEYEGHVALWVIEVCCIIVFTIEYLVKLATAPRRLEFARQPMNVIDLAAIVPFYFELIMIAVSGGDGSNVPTGLLRLLRLFRVFRVLKLGTRMKKLEVVAAAVGDSLDMFVMLVFLLFLALVLFSTLIYFCERDVWVGEDAVLALAGDPFASIPRSFWWCMVTLMTVGYGDSYPATIEGKVVASVTMIASVLIMALPISVIGANFTQRWLVYRDAAAAKAREETMVPDFVTLVRSLESHNFVLQEVLEVTEEMEVSIEQESGALRRVFDEATEIERAEDGDERAKRRGLLAEFDARFSSLRDARDDLDEVLAYAELLSSNLFTSNLEACANKNRRLEKAMDAADETITEVDALIRKVNMVNELKAGDSSPRNVSLIMRGGPSPVLSRQNTQGSQ
jgi:hypothetical protein